LNQKHYQVDERLKNLGFQPAFP